MYPGARGGVSGLFEDAKLRDMNTRDVVYRAAFRFFEVLSLRAWALLGELKYIYLVAAVLFHKVVQCCFSIHTNSRNSIVRLHDLSGVCDRGSARIAPQFLDSKNVKYGMLAISH